jgi:DNA-binding winged helix-turn-helix (wHTH) protein/Flp pilus assembly protein TadD
VQTEPGPSSGRLRFGDYEVDVGSHELLHAGRRVRLQEKSFLVLQALLESPGRVVTREELAAALWPKEHFVDAEHGLNTAVRRLREALGDSADDARFIETLPKRGYRFIGAVETGCAPVDRQPPGDTPPATAGGSPRLSRGVLGAATLVAVALALAALLAVRSRFSGNQAGAAARAPSAGTSDAVSELLARSRYLRNHKRFAEARTFVEEVLKLDPKNADALAGLALSLLGEGRDGEARETARRALELDPNAGEAHRALGVLERGAGNFAAAERHFRRAVDAAPADYKTRNRLSRHLLECGKFDEAKELIVETKRAAPDDPDVQNIWMEYALRTGDYESAIRQGEIWMSIWAKQITGQPTPSVRDMLGLAYVGARRQEDALAQFRAVDPGDDLRVALALGYGGRSAEAHAILDAHERAEAAAGKVEDPGLDGAMAMDYIALGEFDRAFAHLDRQLAARWFPSWLNCKLFHAIRRDPRWTAFARRLESEFVGREEGGTAPGISGVVQILQSWPRPAQGASRRRAN